MEAEGRSDVIGAIHVFHLVSETSSSVTPAGRVVKATTSTPVEGRVDELSARDVEVAAQVGQTHDVCCLAPLETVVDDQMTVIVTAPTRLAGTYKVDAVRTTRKHLRILASRTTVKA